MENGPEQSPESAAPMPALESGPNILALESGSEDAIYGYSGGKNNAEEEIHALSGQANYVEDAEVLGEWRRDDSYHERIDPTIHNVDVRPVGSEDNSDYDDSSAHRFPWGPTGSQDNITDATLVGEPVIPKDAVLFPIYEGSQSASNAPLGLPAGRIGTVPKDAARLRFHPRIDGEPDTRTRLQAEIDNIRQRSEAQNWGTGVYAIRDLMVQQEIQSAITRANLGRDTGQEQLVPPVSLPPGFSREQMRNRLELHLEDSLSRIQQAGRLHGADEGNRVWGFVAHEQEEAERTLDLLVNEFGWTREQRAAAANLIGDIRNQPVERPQQQTDNAETAYARDERTMVERAMGNLALGLTGLTTRSVNRHLPRREADTVWRRGLFGEMIAMHKVALRNRIRQKRIDTRHRLVAAEAETNPDQYILGGISRRGRSYVTRTHGRVDRNVAWINWLRSREGSAPPDGETSADQLVSDRRRLEHAARRTQHRTAGARRSNLPGSSIVARLHEAGHQSARTRIDQIDQVLARSGQSGEDPRPGFHALDVIKSGKPPSEALRPPRLQEPRADETRRYRNPTRVDFM